MCASRKVRHLQILRALRLCVESVLLRLPLNQLWSDEQTIAAVRMSRTILRPFESRPKEDERL
jgi:hypothetical protein